MVYTEWNSHIQANMAHEKYTKMPVIPNLLLCMDGETQFTSNRCMMVHMSDGM
jgi:hypothetical protein